jgi:hypothetical protein
MTNPTAKVEKKERYKERIYDINGFQIRFFTEKELEALIIEEGGFELVWIKRRI